MLPASAGQTSASLETMLDACNVWPWSQDCSMLIGTSGRSLKAVPRPRQRWEVRGTSPRYQLAEYRRSIGHAIGQIASEIPHLFPFPRSAGSLNPRSSATIFHSFTISRQILTGFFLKAIPRDGCPDVHQEPRHSCCFAFAALTIARFWCPLARSRPQLNGKHASTQYGCSYLYC